MKKQLPTLIAALFLAVGCASPRLVVEMTPESPRLVEIELQAVHVQNSAVKTVGPDAIFTVPTVTGLIEGQLATVTHSFAITAANGCEATVKGVTEWIYPTEFTCLSEIKDPPKVSLEVSVIGAVVTPSSFETREVGTILSVLPIVLETGDIQVQISPNITVDPTWHFYTQGGSPTMNEDGFAQPFFESLSLSTTTVLKNGRSSILAACPSRDDKASTTVIMISARILN
jgi:hypothetical protein